MTELHVYTTIESPLGEILLTSSGGAITGLYILEQFPSATVRANTYTPQSFEEACKQLNEYFEGKRYEFDLPLSPEGTDFQKKVWKTLLSIPYGKTQSYRQIANYIGHMNAARAVGTANRKNPISIIVPCHRVIGADGLPKGYHGKVGFRKWLLEHESKHMKQEISAAASS